MLPTGGDGSSSIKYVNGSWQIITGNEERMTVGSGGTTVNKLTISGDIDAGGGFRKQLIFLASGTLEGAKEEMKLAELDGQGFSKIALPGPGSVTKFALYSQDEIVASGALTGTVCIDGAATALKLIIASGSYKLGTSVAKDVIKFNDLSILHVTLTASDYYGYSTDWSGSWIGVVEIES